MPDAYDPRNAVTEFTIDSTTGVLTPTTQQIVMADNSPTFVAVDPAGKFAYVVNRGSNLVEIYSISPDTGNLNIVGSASTGAQPWRATVDPTGKFLYVGNENDDSVSIYAIKSDGTLTLTSRAGTEAAAYQISIIAPKQ